MVKFREDYKGILPELTEGVWRRLKSDGIDDFMKELPQTTKPPRSTRYKRKKTPQDLIRDITNLEKDKFW